MPTDTNSTSVDTNVTIATNTPSWGNHKFLGWCNGTITTTNDTDICSGNTYLAGASYALSGTDTNALNLTAMWQGPPKIQDLSLSQCQVNVGTNGNPANIGDEIVVVDARDGNEYTVKYINGECWMTQNLRFAGTSLDPATSNVTSSKTLTYYSLDSSDASYAGRCNSTNGNNNACIKEHASTEIGAWYNFYAASAGTISGSSNSSFSSQDICPKNWRLPTGPNTTSGTDLSRLVGNTTSGWQNPTTGFVAFNATSGGRYLDGTLSDSERGYWWSSTANGTSYRYSLYFNESDNQFRGEVYNSLRYVGRFARCVLAT